MDFAIYVEDFIQERNIFQNILKVAKLIPFLSYTDCDMFY